MKQDLIVEAATTMFARYGYAKTTIDDIVSEAGVARQTLYNAFSSKEDILRAVVRRSGDMVRDMVLAGWADHEDLEDRLAIFQDFVVCKSYELILSSPDWESLVDGIYKAAAEEMAEQDRAWRAETRALFEAAVPDIAALEPSLDDIIDFFHSGSLNAKHGVENVDHLRRRLVSVRRATMALLGLD